MLHLHRITLDVYKIILRSLFLYKIVTENCVLSEENDLLREVTLRSLVQIYLRFEEVYCLHPQD
jgi:hypothetical protein